MALYHAGVSDFDGFIFLFIMECKVISACKQVLKPTQIEPSMLLIIIHSASIIIPVVFCVGVSEYACSLLSCMSHSAFVNSASVVQESSPQLLLYYSL